MNNNLPMKYKENFITKVIKFLKNIFKISKEETPDSVIIENNKELEIHKNEKFNNELKVNVNNDFLKENERNEFIEKIEKNPNLLYELSNERLEILEKYYDKLIEEDRKKLENLKKVG